MGHIQERRIKFRLHPYCNHLMCNKDLRRKENQSEDGIIKGSPTIREKLSSKNLASKKYLPSSPSERYDTKHPIIE